MKILLTGGYGFIGSHCAAALTAAGHAVVRGGRKQRRAATAGLHMELDFTRDFDPGVWQERLRGFDVVINTVGIMTERGAQSFESLHVRAPRALFAACAALGIKVINLSALGADEGARSRYHLTKKAADDYLLSLHFPAVVVQPSLVYGDDGASARLFRMLAALPLVPLPGDGQQSIQPIHIDDLTAALVALLETDRYGGRRVALVGPALVTFRRLLTELRLAMGMNEPRFVSVPAPVVSLAARIAGAARSRVLSPEAWQMLQRGNVADPADTRALLGREPRPPGAFLTGPLRHHARREAELAWLLALLRLTIAIVWVTAGVVSTGLYPLGDSLALLAQVGIAEALAPWLLYGAAAIDIALGIGTMILRDRRLLWITQAAVVLGYTLIITLWLPEYWLHPFGPVVKNLPLLAAIYLLYQLERR